jgi:hypothetical protein
MRHEPDEHSLEHLRRMGSIMWNSGFLGLKKDPDRIFRFLSKHCHYFLDIEQWMEFLVRFEFSTGTRLHGNMLAWQAGVPAVWIPHDSRTAELIRCMAVPTLDRRYIHPKMTLRELLDRADFDGERYDSRRAGLCKSYCDFLQAAGLSLGRDHKWLKKLAAGSGQSK